MRGGCSIGEEGAWTARGKEQEGAREARGGDLSAGIQAAGIGSREDLS